MPADIRQLPREEFIEKNLGLVHACAGRFKGRGSNMRNCTLRAVWGWSRPAMALTPAAASAFPPTLYRSFWARSKSCSGTVAQSR